MAKAFTDSDISSFLKGLIELGEAQTVDDSPDKYIRSAITGEQVTMTQEGKRVPLAIYGTSASDAIIINPFSEGETESTKNSWFIESRNTILGTLIAGVIEKLLTIGAENKDKKKVDKGEENRLATKYLSKCVLDIDEKMIDEFVTIRQDIYKFFHISYNKTKRLGEVKCLVFNPLMRDSFKKQVRQKSWGVFEKLVFAVLNTEDLADFTYKPDSIGIPVFEAFANILIDVYDHIKDALKIVDIKVPGLNALKSHLKYLKEYQAAAAWCSTANVGVQQPANVAPTPWSLPQSTLPPSVVPMANTGMMPYTSVPQMPMQMPPMMSPFGVPTVSTLPPTLSTTVPINPMPVQVQTVGQSMGVPTSMHASDNPFIQN